MPPNPPSNAHGFAMRSMSLRDMQIPKSEKKISWPPPLPNPGDAPEQSSASTMYANNNICNFEITLRKNTFGFMQRLEQSTNSIISTLYQSWIVRFDIWNSWIKSLYVT